MCDLKKCPTCEDSTMVLCEKEPVNNNGTIERKSVFVCPKCHNEEPFKTLTTGALEFDMEELNKLYKK